ncbi:ABC transporter substrate-binding protein [Saccharopolyspora sp. K220]|uniref:ABC transporter substrate-binding protein n=1 Tax=Saccharopolyspora soli TaxID=2926618 RepID=UPI001F5AF336|nr:ABC transporter substrate-binding protein [Saccharopolyspora soli]MCI2415999.1 ABC transporter substrate-binding protein [Saccharopolyspora soli]
MTRTKRWRWAAALAITAAVATGCSAEAGPPSIRVGIVCGGISLAAITIDEGGLPDGLQAQKTCFDSGSDAVQALAGGSIDAFVGAGEHIVNNRAKGLDVKGYAVVSEKPPYSLVSPTSAPVAQVADLAGKSVAVTAPGSLSDTELQRAAAEAGIAYKGLRVVGAGTGATMQATIEKGGAAAGMVSDPLLTTMVQSGKFTVTWQPSFRYVALAVIAKSSWVDDHQPAMRAFVKALRATQDRAESDPTSLLAAAQQQAPGLSQQVLAAVLQATLDQAPAGLTIDEGPYRDTTQVLVQVGQTQQDKIPAFADAFDFRLLGRP